MTTNQALAPRIVCAAIRNEMGNIVLGIRHFDMLMHETLNFMRAAQPSLHAGNTNWEQGFVDQYGIFYNREQAFRVAKEQGQIQRKTDYPESVVLYSEDLY